MLHEAIVCYSTQKYEREGEAYPEPGQTSNIELFAKIINGWNFLFPWYVGLGSILDVRLSSECASVKECI